MNGIIVLNKQKGMTSNQAVMKVKHLLKEKHVGHTGTLDPEVTGVLPIVIGKATKLVSLMDNDKKVYEATILIGQRSDTLDAFGTILESEIVNELEDPTPFLHSFLGTYMQIPPMFSALHYEGKRMYELAREKIEVPREAREMTIFEISQTSPIIYLDGHAEFKFKVVGSKGLYVRSLCEDIAKKMGHLGLMKELVRLQTGAFSLQESYSLCDIEQGNYHLISLEEYFKDSPTIEVSPYMEKMVGNGIYLDERQIKTHECFRVYRENRLLAIYQPCQKEYQYSPLIIL